MGFVDGRLVRRRRWDWERSLENSKLAMNLTD